MPVFPWFSPVFPRFSQGFPQFSRRLPGVCPQKQAHGVHRGRRAAQRWRKGFGTSEAIELELDIVGIWGQVKIGGPEQAPGPHPFHTPVPYLLEGSVPYLCSIPLFHTSNPYVIIYIIIYNYYLYIYTYIYIFDYVQSDFTFVHTYMSAYMQEYVYYAQALLLCWQVCACSTYSCYLLCCVMVGIVGMCLAAASWQSKNGLLVTLPPSQPVAGLCLHHLKLLQAVAQLLCLIVEMRLAAASWPSKNCLLRYYSRSKLRILIKMCCVVVVLCWSGPFRSRPRSIPFHTRSRPGPPMYHP